MYRKLLPIRPKKQQQQPATMSPPAFIGAIDQGTTSTRFIIFNVRGEEVASHQFEFEQIYPQPG